MVRLIPKIKIPSGLIKLAYNFVDLEASGETAVPFGVRLYLRASL